LACVSQKSSRLTIEAVSSEAGWTLTIADTLPAAIEAATGELAPIILFDRELSPRYWREAVGLLTSRSPRPYLILLSASSDRNLWEELHRVGGSDILRTPLDRKSALEAVGRAWFLWRSEQQLRRLSLPSQR
jgi:CheY-like chemotaxis protein